MITVLVIQGHEDEKDNGDGIEEFDANDELLARAEDLMRDGKRVIILDDASIGADTINALQKNTDKENGKDFCVIAANKISSRDRRSLFFVNLHAMALMGVAVLQGDYDGLRLFDLAYELFTGQKDHDDLLKQFKNKELLVITIMPRMIKLTGGSVDQRDLQRLFAAAA